MMTEAQKQSIYKWRQTHHDEFLIILRNDYKKYYQNNKDKERLRLKKYNDYKKETKRLRFILL